MLSRGNCKSEGLYFISIGFSCQDKIQEYSSFDLQVY